MQRRPRCALAAATGLVFLALVGIVGCSRSKPELASEPVAPLQSERQQPKITYRLSQPIDAQKARVPGHTFTVTVDNCAGESTLERVHEERHTIASSVSLLVGEGEAASQDEQRALRAAIMAAYDLAEGEQVWEGAVTLVAPPHSQVEYTLRWDEDHDANVVERVSDGEVTAEAPAQVVRSATLLLVTAVPQPCPAGEVNVPVVVGETAAEAQGETLSLEIPPAGSAEAMGLIQDYVEALSLGNLEDAYGYFYQAYQQRVPFESYRRGYAAVVEYEIHSIDVLKVTKYMERAEVVMTLGMQAQGEIAYSDWMMTADISIDRGRPPYQRSISYVTMRRLGLE